MNAQHDPFGRAKVPRSTSRAGRVSLVAEVARALLEGRLPPAESRLFVAGALLAWLEHGGRVGSLERDHLRTAPPRSSTVTAAELWRRCSSRGETDDGGTGDHRQHHEQPEDVTST